SLGLQVLKLIQHIKCVIKGYIHIILLHQIAGEEAILNKYLYFFEKMTPKRIYSKMCYCLHLVVLLFLRESMISIIHQKSLADIDQINEKDICILHLIVTAGWAWTVPDLQLG
ncbi:hypothetical protein ACJX0J_032640, partial [Zea mays]